MYFYCCYLFFVCLFILLNHLIFVMLSFLYYPFWLSNLQPLFDFAQVDLTDKSIRDQCFHLDSPEPADWWTQWLLLIFSYFCPRCIPSPGCSLLLSMLSVCGQRGDGCWKFSLEQGRNSEQMSRRKLKGHEVRESRRSTEERRQKGYCWTSCFQTCGTCVCVYYGLHPAAASTFSSQLPSHNQHPSQSGWLIVRRARCIPLPTERSGIWHSREPSSRIIISNLFPQILKGLRV